MLFTDDGVLAAGLIDPTYKPTFRPTGPTGPPAMDPPPSQSPAPPRKVPKVRVPLRRVAGVRQRLFSRALNDGARTSMSHSTLSPVLVNAPQVYRVVVRGLAWTDADVAWVASLPPAPSTNPAASRAASRPVCPWRLVRDVPLPEGPPSPSHVAKPQGTPPDNEGAHGSGVDGASASGGGGGGGGAFHDAAHASVDASDPRPPALRFGGVLPVKGWAWQRRFGTAAAQLMFLRRPLHYHDSSQVRGRCV